MTVADIDRAIAKLEAMPFSYGACERLRTLYAVRSQLVKKEREADVRR